MKRFSQGRRLFTIFHTKTMNAVAVESAIGKAGPGVVDSISWEYPTLCCGARDKAATVCLKGYI
jgi:hypothetical protein